MILLYNIKLAFQEENKVSENMRQVYRSRGLSITKYSPGAGNWRQNIEHISNHIKVTAHRANRIFIVWCGCISLI